METKKSYSQQLKDPRWQKKRLEIMSRDNFRCVQCENSKNTLHVHHKKYEHGKKPWEYDDSELITLCDTCHELLHIMDDVSKEIEADNEREIAYADGHELNKREYWDKLFSNDFKVPVDPSMINQLLRALGDHEHDAGNIHIMCMLYDFCDVLSIENINTVTFKVFNGYIKLLHSYKNVLLFYLRQNALNSDIIIRANYTDGTHRMYL